MSKPISVSIQQAIQEAESEIERFVNAESALDPMLRVILLGRIDLSISNIADSIEKNYFEGSVIKRSDGSIDPLQSIITSNHLEYVRYSLEETKKEYLSQHNNVTSPADILVMNMYYIITFFSIREEWDSWAIKQQLLADEAIPLMNGLDPRSWKEYQNNEKNLPLEMVESIERCLKIAGSDGSIVKSPAEWIAWGREYDLDKPILKSNQSNIPDICMFSLFESALQKKVNAQSEYESPNGICNKSAVYIEDSEEICALFDPMNQKAIKLLFNRVTESDWTEYFNRAARNGLKDIREKGGRYNPAKIGEWLVKNGLYTQEQVDRKLANNLPDRSKDKKCLITGDFN